MLASLLYPYDDDAPALIDGWLEELEKEKQIRRYVIDGSEYLEIVKWLEHQKIDRPSPSRLPPPRDVSTEPREASRNVALDLGPVPRTSIKEGSGEGPQLARPDLKLVDEGKPLKIDETYEPSERAVEYAFSLGMKKSDLNGELSKFIATSMAAGAVSFNIDMSFKVWCDRWLEFKLRKDPQWKPAAEVKAQVDLRPIVIEGTLEHTCWNSYNREKGLRPLFLCKQMRPDGTVVDRAARCETLFPPGFNDFGERIQSSSEDAA